MNNKSSLNNQVRIIAGKWRGRKLSFPPVAGLRPTQDRIRETLFNWLAPTIVGANCLDLFAGSGALGFEALSRGADHTTFIDVNHEVIQALIENAKRLQADSQVSIQLAKTLTLSRYLRPVPVRGERVRILFNLVFLDPPFYQNLIGESLIFLLTNNLLRENCLIYFEAEKNLSIDVTEKFSVIQHQFTSTLQYGLLEITAQPSVHDKI